MTVAIQVEGMTKRFGEVHALAGVNIETRAGTVLALLGPNGAGKTTLVRILCTLERADEGKATVCGHDVTREPREVRRLIGVTGQYTAVDEDISGRENLYMIARLLRFRPHQARSRADELLELLGLTDAGRRTTRHYSGGMRRRLDLAASLIGNPRVLFLDEPTTGLDPHSRNALWDIVRERARAGTTVLLTTQYMEEAEALAGNVVVIDRGRVVAEGTTAQLRARVGGRVLRVRLHHPSHLDRIARVLQSSTVDEEDGLVRLPITSDEQFADALRALGACGLPLAGVDTNPPSLDEVFLTLTGAGRVGGKEEA
jgi:daunorubicin resistance ABC transporter ATP-binding subunit